MSTTLLDAALSPAPLLVVKVSLLLGAAGCVAALLRRRTSAATRHLVWNLALIGALAIPIASIALPGWTFAIGLAPDAAAPVIDRRNEFVAIPSTPASVTANEDSSARRRRPVQPLLDGADRRGVLGRRRGHADRVARATLERAPVRAPRERPSGTRSGTACSPSARAPWACEATSACCEASSSRCR